MAEPRVHFRVTRSGATGRTMVTCSMWDAGVSVRWEVHSHRNDIADAMKEAKQYASEALAKATAASA